MINGIGSSSPVQRIVTQPVQKQLPAEPAKQLRAADRLEISGADHLLKTMKAGADVRVDLVQNVKQQIAAGTYVTDAKVNAAVERLMAELG